LTFQKLKISTLALKIFFDVLNLFIPQNFLVLILQNSNLVSIQSEQENDFVVSLFNL